MPRPIRGGLSPQAVSRFGLCENQAAVRDEKALHQRAQPKASDLRENVKQRFAEAGNAIGRGIMPQRAQPKASDLRENVKQRSQKPTPLGGGDKTSLQFFLNNKNKKGSEEIDNAES